MRSVGAAGSQQDVDVSSRGGAGSRGAIRGGATVAVFLSESRRDDEAVNARQLELLMAHPATAPHAWRALVIDDFGNRKDANKTAHVSRQYLGRVGKTDNGIVTVTTVWADERIYYPLLAHPYDSGIVFSRGRQGSRVQNQVAERRPGDRHGQNGRGDAGRWWPTASTARTTGYAVGCVRWAGDLCWRSSLLTVDDGTARTLSFSEVAV